ncbi:MAG: winged helix-turn-helix domain-containing protein [Chloroflexota bacterium]
MNPYRRDIILQGIVSPEGRFIGLHEELEWLFARLSENRPAAVSLVGPWGVGKSLLLAFLAKYQASHRMFYHALGKQFVSDPERLLFVTIDCDHLSPGEDNSVSFFTLVYQEVTQALTTLLQVDDVQLIPFDRIPTRRFTSVEIVRTHIHRVLAQVQEDTDDDELYERFYTVMGSNLPDRLLELLKRIEAWGIRVVLLVDNFDVVAPHLTCEDCDHLRELISVASLVIATRKALSELVASNVQSSPFFNLVHRLDLMNIHFLSIQEARRLIQEPPTWFEQTAWFQFSESDITFILEIAGLDFDLIRATCEYLYIRTHQRVSSEQTDLLPDEERPFLQALLRRQFVDIFASLWYPLDNDERAKLHKIAQSELTAIKPQHILPKSALTNLVARGYVIFEQGRYRLFAGLFRDYVLEQHDRPPEPETVQVPPSLTNLETKFLDMLRSKPGQVVQRNEIIITLYGPITNEQDRREYRRRLDTLVFRLRGKLEGAPMLIENIRRQGYRLVLLKEKQDQLTYT